MIPRIKTLSSLTVVLPLLLLLGGIVYAVTQISRDVAATVNVQVKTTDGIEVYLDADLTQVAELFSFGDVEVDVFGTTTEPVRTPVVWVHNRSNSGILLSLTDNFALGDVTFQPAPPPAVSALGEPEPTPTSVPPTPMPTPTPASPRPPPVPTLFLPPGEVVRGILTLRFHQGIAGTYNFTVFFQAEGPVPVPVTSGGTLRVGMASGHSTFDPPPVTRLQDIAAVQHMYDGLVFRNPDQSLQPALATSWSANADATQWTFRLREGVRFHHGKGFNAEDVVFTFNRLFEVGSPLAGVMTRPTAIVALDDYTVRFDFDSPNAVLLESIVKYHAYITPSDVDPARFANEDFGTGPFIMTEHVTGEGTFFKKNPDYWWEGYPLVDQLIFLYINDSITRAGALRAGEIHVIFDLNIASVATLRDDPNTLVAQTAGGGYMNLWMDVRVPPFNNKLVRQALQAVTDRQAILEFAQLGLGGIAYDHPVTPGDPVYNSACTPPAYNPELAIRLLEEAGYPDGIALTLYTSNAGAPMVEMAEVFAATAAPAGIDISIVQTNPATYWSDVWLVQPFGTAWWGGRPPYEAFSIVYASDAPWNESHWSNAGVDELLAKALTTADLGGNQAIFAELQCLVINEVPRIIPVFRPVLLGLRNDVRGMEPMWDSTLSVHRAWLDR